MIQCCQAHVILSDAISRQLAESPSYDSTLQRQLQSKTGGFLLGKLISLNL